LRKEDVFSVVLKFYSIILMFSLFLNYVKMKAIILAVGEIEKNSEFLLTPYNLGMLVDGVMLFLIIYIWHRANKILQVESFIDFKSGAYIFLGMYWLVVGICAIDTFVIDIYYSTYQNQSNASFSSDLFFEGLGIFMVGGVIVVYWFWRIDKVKRGEI
jgi:hypothetical protein